MRRTLTNNNDFGRSEGNFLDDFNDGLELLGGEERIEFRKTPLQAEVKVH